MKSGQKIKDRELCYRLKKTGTNERSSKRGDKQNMDRMERMKWKSDGSREQQWRGGLLE